MPEGDVVADTGPLIALLTIGRLETLRVLHGRVLVPAAVLREVAAGGRDRTGVQEVEQATWIERVTLDSPPDLFLQRELGAGEAEAITLAVRGRVGAVLLDERLGRRIAEAVYGLKVRGTVGTLAAAKHRGLIPALRPLLEELQRSGYHLSSRLIDNACGQVGE